MHNIVLTHIVCVGYTIAASSSRMPRVLAFIRRGRDWEPQAASDVLGWIRRSSIDSLAHRVVHRHRHLQLLCIDPLALHTVGRGLFEYNAVHVFTTWTIDFAYAFIKLICFAQSSLRLQLYPIVHLLSTVNVSTSHIPANTCYSAIV